MSQQQSMQDRRVTVGDAVIWNSRRIEKLEEHVTKNTNKVEMNVTVQTKLDAFQQQLKDLQSVVLALEQRVEKETQVSLTITEEDEEEEEGDEDEN